MLSAASSSSACSNTRPREGPSTESADRIPLPGVMGYPAANLHPPASAPSAAASFPDRITRGRNSFPASGDRTGRRPSAHSAPDRTAFRFFSRTSSRNSRARSRSTVSSGAPRRRATIPTPTMFARIGFPAATASSLSGTPAGAHGSVSPAGSERTMPPGRTAGRKCGRWAGSRTRRMSASSRPPRTGTSIDADGVGVAASPDPAHVILRGVEVVPRGHGHAGDDPSRDVHALTGSSRDAYVDVVSQRRLLSP